MKKVFCLLACGLLFSCKTEESAPVPGNAGNLLLKEVKETATPTTINYFTTHYRYDASGVLTSVRNDTMDISYTVLPENLGSEESPYVIAIYKSGNRTTSVFYFCDPAHRVVKEVSGDAQKFFSYNEDNSVSRVITHFTKETRRDTTLFEYNVKVGQEGLIRDLQLSRQYRQLANSDRTSINNSYRHNYYQAGKTYEKGIKYPFNYGNERKNLLVRTQFMPSNLGGNSEDWQYSYEFDANGFMTKKTALKSEVVYQENTTYFYGKP